MRRYEVKFSTGHPDLLATWTGDALNDMHAVALACDEYKLNDEERMDLVVEVRPLPNGTWRRYVTVLALKNLPPADEPAACTV